MNSQEKMAQVSFFIYLIATHTVLEYLISKVTILMAQGLVYSVALLLLPYN